MIHRSLSKLLIPGRRHMFTKTSKSDDWAMSKFSKNYDINVISQSTVTITADFELTTNASTGRAWLLLIVKAQPLTSSYWYKLHKPLCHEWSNQEKSPRQRDDQEQILSIKDGRNLPAVESSCTKLKTTRIGPVDEKIFIKKTGATDSETELNRLIPDGKS